MIAPSVMEAPRVGHRVDTKTVMAIVFLWLNRLRLRGVFPYP